MSPKLAVIVLDENELTSESIETGAFSSLTELRRISFARNNVKVFPAGMPYSLKEIYAPHNGMARIPSMALSQLTNVEILDLSHNQFTDESFGDKSYGLANLVNLRKEQFLTQYFSLILGDIEENFCKTHQRFI